MTLWTFTCIYRCKHPCMPYMYSRYQISFLSNFPIPTNQLPPWSNCPSSLHHGAVGHRGHNRGRHCGAILGAKLPLVRLPWAAKKKHPHWLDVFKLYIYVYLHPLKTNKRPLKSDHFSKEYIWSNHRFSGDMLVFRGVIVIQSFIGGGIPIQSTLIGGGIPIQSWIGGADSPFFGQKSEWFKYPMNDLGFGSHRQYDWWVPNRMKELIIATPTRVVEHPGSAMAGHSESCPPSYPLISGGSEEFLQNPNGFVPSFQTPMLVKIYVPSGKLTWHSNGISPFLIGNTSSQGPFSSQLC